MLIRTGDCESYINICQRKAFEQRQRTKRDCVMWDVLLLLTLILLNNEMSKMNFAKCTFWFTSPLAAPSAIGSHRIASNTETTREWESRTVKTWRESCALQMIAFSKLMVIDRTEWNRASNNNYEAIDLCCFGEFPFFSHRSFRVLSNTRIAYRIDDVLRSRINEIGSWCCRESDRRQEHRVKAMKSLLLLLVFFSFAVPETHLNGLPDEMLSTNQNIALHVSRVSSLNTKQTLWVIKAIRRWKLFSLVVWFLNLCLNLKHGDVTRNHISLDSRHIFSLCRVIVVI